MILQIDADMQLALADALFLLFDQYLEAHVLDYECPMTAASYLDMVADLFEGIPQRVDEASMRNEPTKPRSIMGESRENLIERCAPFIDKVVEASSITPVSADQALLVKSSKRLRDLLKHTRHDTIKTDPAGSLKLLLPTFPTSPQSQEADLCREGEVLGASFAQRPDDSPVLVTVTMWTRNLVLTSTDSLCQLERRDIWDRSRLQKAPQDPETRLVAVFSIKHFMQSFSAAGGMLQETLEFLHIWLLLCDLLVDDDEDVRTQAAELTCEMLQRCAQQKGCVKQAWTVSPPATKSRLLDYLVHSYSRSDRFWVETIVRLTGQLSRVGLQSRVAASGDWEHILLTGYTETIGSFRPLDGFRMSRSRSQPVFEEENHNLYLDPVREADVWTNAATNLVLPLCDEGRSKNQTGSTWLNALATLSAAMDEFGEITEADGEIRKDGPLGYASAPEAFSVIFAITCLLRLWGQGIKDASTSQKLPGWWLDKNSFAHLRYTRKDDDDTETWLQKNRLRAGEARLHELLVSKLDDLLEIFGSERLCHPSTSPVDRGSESTDLFM